VPEQQWNFGGANFSGGQQNFGNHNTNNYYEMSPREQVENELTKLRSTHPDPVAAEPQIMIIEREMANPSPDGRGRITKALEALAADAGNVRTAVEATVAIGSLVAANWPF
jgi:hypothetical protein